MWGLIAASLFDNNGLVFGATHESVMASSLYILAHFFAERLFEFWILRHTQKCIIIVYLRLNMYKPRKLKVTCKGNSK
jgi:hypothetical protein